MTFPRSAPPRGAISIHINSADPDKRNAWEKASDRASCASVTGGSPLTEEIGKARKVLSTAEPARSAPVASSGSVRVRGGSPPSRRSSLLFCLTMQATTAYGTAPIGTHALGDVATFPELYRDMRRGGCDTLAVGVSHIDKDKGLTTLEVIQGFVEAEPDDGSVEIHRESGAPSAYVDTFLQKLDDRDPRHLEFFMADVVDDPNAAKVPGGDARKEAFQILGDSLTSGKAIPKPMFFRKPERQDISSALNTANAVIMSVGLHHLTCTAVEGAVVQCPGGVKDFTRQYGHVSPESFNDMFNVAERLKESGHRFAITVSNGAWTDEHRLFNFVEGLKNIIAEYTSWIGKSVGATRKATHDFLLGQGHALMECSRSGGADNVTISTPDPLMLPILQRYAARNAARCELQIERIPEAAPDSSTGSGTRTGEL